RWYPQTPRTTPLRLRQRRPAPSCFCSSSPLRVDAGTVRQSRASGTGLSRRPCHGQRRRTDPVPVRHQRICTLSVRDSPLLSSQLTSTVSPEAPPLTLNDRYGLVDTDGPISVVMTTLSLCLAVSSVM